MRSWWDCTGGKMEQKTERESYIPKIIHYSWFGGKEKPEFIRKCISTWEKNMPEYRIVEWNESNFSLEEHPFALEAYRA